MGSPENLEAPNSSETHGGSARIAPTSTQRALGAAALRGAASPSTQRALGAAALRGAGGRTPEALEAAARELEAIASKIVQVAQATQDYQSRVSPITQGVEHEVGGSATGKDKQIAALLKDVSKDVAASAAATHQASQVAKRLAAQARAEAQEMRRQQESDRQRSTGR